MKIADIYNKFCIPPNLQDHMLRVGSIVEYLKIHWKDGLQVDWELATKLALLHDLGNIVKFDFDKNSKFLGDEQKNIDYWRKSQSKIIEIYGNDDDKVTSTMLSELGIDKGMVEIIFNKRFGNSVNVEKSNDWILKILYYADLRVLPFGIGSLEDRIADIRERMPKYTNRPDFETLVESCLNIGKQIETKLNIPVNKINDNNVGVNRKLLELEI